MPISIGAMVKAITGLQGTNDISGWEEEFIESVADRSRNGEDTQMLSSKQVEIIERIYKKHY
jgi:hypothetical protein